MNESKVGALTTSFGKAFQGEIALFAKKNFLVSVLKMFNLMELQIMTPEMVVGGSQQEKLVEGQLYSSVNNLPHHVKVKLVKVKLNHFPSR